MLEPIRQFAAQRLAGTDREPELQRRAIDWYLAAARDLEDREEEMIRAFRGEPENFLRLFEYSARLEEWLLGIELGYRTIGGVFGVAGTAELVASWVERAEAQADAFPGSTRAQLAAIDVPRAVSRAEQDRRATELARVAGDPRMLKQALCALVPTELDEGEVAAAERALDEAEAIDVHIRHVSVDIPINRALIAEARGDSVGPPVVGCSRVGGPGDGGRDGSRAFAVERLRSGARPR